MPSHAAHRLLFHGFLLFLLGLLSGLVAYQLASPRAGVAAHVEGLMNGLFLIALGLVWPKLVFSPRAAALVFWSALVGAYANWGFTLFAAAAGTSAPILMNQGLRGSAWQEAVMSASAVLGVLPPLICTLVVLSGLRAKHARAPGA